MAAGSFIPDGNEALRDDMPTIVELIERTSTMGQSGDLPAYARMGATRSSRRPLYDGNWSRRYTNTRKATGITVEKFEGIGVVAVQVSGALIVEL